MQGMRQYVLTEKAVLQGHTAWVTSCTMHGSISLTGSNDSTVHVWNLSHIPCVDDDAQFAASSCDVFDDIDDVSAQVFNGSLIGHKGGITCMWHENGLFVYRSLLHCIDTVVTGSLDKTIRHWDLETRKCVNILRSERYLSIC